MQFTGSVKRIFAFALALALVFGLVPNAHAADDHGAQTIAASHGVPLIQRTQTREPGDVVYTPIEADATLEDGRDYVIATQDGEAAYVLFDDGAEDEADPDSYKVTTIEANLVESDVINPSNGMLWTYSAEKGFISNAAWETEHYLFGGIPAENGETGIYSLTTPAAVVLSGGTIKFTGETVYFLRYDNGVPGVSTESGTAFIIYSCAHANVNSDITASTCTVQGTETVTCVDCGVQLSETLLPLAEHSWDAGVTTAQPTCTVGGSKTLTCTVCGATKVTTLESLGHSYLDATCTLPATCTRCSITTGEALGHEFVLDTNRSIPSTCTSAGLAAYSCSRCTATDDRTIPATDHDWGEWTSNNDGTHSRVCKTDAIHTETANCTNENTVVDPTCTENGYTRHTCSVCAYYYDDTEIDATGHDWGEWTSNNNGTHSHVCKTDATHTDTVDCVYVDTVTAPTCTEDGYTTHTCSVCAYAYNDNTTPATGHTKTEGSGVVTAPTCTEPGYTIYICSVCGEPFTDDYTAATGHTYGNWTSNNNGTHSRVCSNDETHTETTDCEYKTTVTPPSCTAEGKTTYLCEICGYTYDGDKTEKLPHSMVKGEVVPPTCLDKGFTWYTCSVCGIQTKGDETNATGHAYGEWTSNNNGTHSRVCANDATHTETVDCTYENTVVDPTCTEDGYTRHTCSECAYSYDDTVTEATGHDWGVWTSNNDGTHSRVCKTDATHTDTVDCVYVDTVTAPTCTAAGYTTHTCSVCAYAYNDNATPATGHTKTEGSGVVTAPTCTDEGYTTYICSVCGESFRADFTAIIATNHDWKLDSARCTVPNCTETGLEAYTCTHCKQINDRVLAINPDNHDFVVDDERSYLPTCVADGLAAETCTRCAETNDSVIPMTPDDHDFVRDESRDTTPTCISTGLVAYSCSREGCVVTNDTVLDIVPENHEPVRVEERDLTATCVAEGNIGYDCALCNENIDVVTEIDSENHDFVRDEDRDAEPNCTEKGNEAWSCSRCDATNDVELDIDPLNHSLQRNPQADVPATCVSTGKTAYKCVRCDFTTLIVTSDIDPDAHRFVKNEEESYPATCAAEGLDVFYCANEGCNGTKEEVVPIDPDSHVLEATLVEPTCTEDGYTLNNCKYCDYSYQSDTVAALGHDWQDATCTTAKTCARCNETEGEALGHDYVISVVEATCTEGGYTLHSCSRCDDEYRDNELAALGHNFEPDAERSHPATCTEEGVDAYSCSRCDETDDKTLQPLAHPTTEVRNAVAATCTEDGYTGDTYCLVCNEMVEQGEVIIKTGHVSTHTEDAMEPDCTTEGATGNTVCDVCGEVVAASTTIPALGHAPELVDTKAAACTEEGYTGNEVCSRCAEVLSEGISIPALGHDFAEATCTEPATCTRCSETTGEALGHDYTSNVTAPTCTEAGYTTYSCVRCDDEYNDDEVAALGHTLSDATCTEPATCTRCNETFGEALGHDYVGTVTAPTCTEKGYTTYHCSRCDEEYVGSYVDALNHPNREVRGAVEAGCSTDGYTGNTYCPDCKQILEYGESIPQTGHVSTHIEGAVAASCTTPGATGATVCDACEEVLTASTTIAPLGHAPIFVDAKDATCTEKGNTGNETCSRCAELLKIGESIPALGHDWAEATCTEPATCNRCSITDGDPLGHDYSSTVTEPTCTEDGFTTHTCSRCDDSYTDMPTPALGHDFTPATCTAAKTCTRCGETEGEALGHDYPAEWSNYDATNHTKSCTRCDSVIYEAHSWDEGKVSEDDPAVTVYTCSACSATRTETVSGMKLEAVPAAKMLVHLKWEARANASGYEVLRKGENDEDFVSIATVSATAYTDKGISTLGDYRYMVKAFVLDDNGQKQYTASTQSVMVTVSALPKIAYGDADCDTNITASDASAILRYLVSLQSLSVKGMANADCNADAFITAADAAAILRFLVELESALPVAN